MALNVARSMVSVFLVIGSPFRVCFLPSTISIIAHADKLSTELFAIGDIFREIMMRAMVAIAQNTTTLGWLAVWGPRIAPNASSRITANQSHQPSQSHEGASWRVDLADTWAGCRKYRQRCRITLTEGNVDGKLGKLFHTKKSCISACCVIFGGCVFGLICWHRAG